MPGPLPDPASRRRNAPTIPTTRLAASGRSDPAPACPYDLGEAGSAWWAWAWALPQALAWSVGDLYAVARRARLEDEAEPSVAMLRTMTELDGKLGLTPEAMAKLRWQIVSDQPAVADPEGPEPEPRRPVRRGQPTLRAVDPSLAETG
jgi:hypothetical protein